MAQAIDAVITWVDGKDPELIAKQRQYFQVDEKDDVTSRARFVDCNEIFYCMLGIFKNLKFISRIFVVTDNQVPPAIEQIRKKLGDEYADRIIVVDHKEIFDGYLEYLPTFNSPAIETMLHRIPGLSDRYIYFNDDFFVIKPMTEEDFFHQNRPVLRGKWRSAKSIVYNSVQRARMLDGKVSIKAKLFSFKETQYLAFREFGEAEEFFWHDHTPHPFYRPDLENFFAENDDRLRSNIGHKIRHHDQFDVMSLANAIDIRKKNSVFKPMSLTYLKASAKRFQSFYVWRKRLSAKKHESHFICLQALVDAAPKARKAMFEWLNDELLQ